LAFKVEYVSHLISFQPQYIFIHDAILEAIQCGVTDVQARDLRDRFRVMGMVDSYVGLTELEIEYDKLETTVHRRSTKNFGILKINKPKNRYANIETIPCELFISPINTQNSIFNHYFHCHYNKYYSRG